MSRDGGVEAPYWQGLKDGRLMLPRCVGCDRWMWPAGHRCGFCGTIEIEWISQPFRGTTFSWTRTWHRFAGTESLDLPFVSVVAEVDGCGVRLLGLLDDPDEVDPIIGEALTGTPSATMVDGRAVPTIVWRRAT